MASHETYYVPAQSKWPIIASVGLLLTVFGGGSMINGMSSGTGSAAGKWIFFAGALTIAYMMFGWFSSVVKESDQGLYSQQMDRSFRMGMGWFIFSEVMFFAAFFGALFYARTFAGPWLGGDGSPGQLPLFNTIILISSSVTVTFAHHALRADKRGATKAWLGLTVLLGVIFLVLQALEYQHAYHDLGLTLNSGIYGSTFFMLTGFHGAHVTMGTLILAIMLIRITRGHFTPDKHFGFEAASWYWHFVDVVWVGLFVFVYIL